MYYQAVNIYSGKRTQEGIVYSDTCGHKHRTKEAAEKCCDRIYAHNVGNVKEVYDD